MYNAYLQVVQYYFHSLPMIFGHIEQTGYNCAYLAILAPMLGLAVPGSQA